MSKKDNNEAETILGMLILAAIAIVVIVIIAILYVIVMLGGFAAVMGALYGAVTAIKNYFRALFQNVRAVEV